MGEEEGENYGDRCVQSVDIDWDNTFPVGDLESIINRKPL